jgi:PAS domain S-box-containing protein
MERFLSKEGDGAEKALSSREQELRLLVDTIPTLVWTAGPEGDIEYVNKRVLEYLGATLDEIIGNGWVEKVHPDDVAFKSRLGSRISNPGRLTTQSADFEEQTGNIGCLP